MVADFAKFRTAHAAWRKASDEFEAMMRVILENKAEYDKAALFTKCDEIRRLLNEFEAAQEGIVFWK